MAAVEVASHVFEHGDLGIGAWAGAGADAANIGNALRSAGIKLTSDLSMAALVDPELARTLVSKMPASVDNGTMRALRRGLILGPMAVDRPAPAKRPTR